MDSKKTKKKKIPQVPGQQTLRGAFRDAADTMEMMESGFIVEDTQGGNKRRFEVWEKLDEQFETQENYREKVVFKRLKKIEEVPQTDSLSLDDLNQFGTEEEEGIKIKKKLFVEDSCPKATEEEIEEEEAAQDSEQEADKFADSALMAGSDPEDNSQNLFPTPDAGESAESNLSAPMDEEPDVWQRAYDMLTEMHETEEVYVSNETEGDMYASKVERICKEKNHFSDDFIRNTILQLVKPPAKVENAASVKKKTPLIGTDWGVPAVGAPDKMAAMFAKLSSKSPILPTKQLKVTLPFTK